MTDKNPRGFAHSREQFQQLEEQKKQVLKQIDDQRQKILEGALNQLVEKKLIEAAAAKRGVSADDLLKAEVDSKVAQVTSDTITSPAKAAEFVNAGASI